MSCGHANPEQAKFCLECGAPLAARCARCGTELRETEQRTYCVGQVSDTTAMISGTGTGPQQLGIFPYEDTNQVTLAQLGSVNVLPVSGAETTQRCDGFSHTEMGTGTCGFQLALILRLVEMTQGVERVRVRARRGRMRGSPPVDVSGCDAIASDACAPPWT